MSVMPLSDDVEAIIMISCEDENKTVLLYHRILDALLDHIDTQNVYKNFSLALEHVNALLTSWRDGDGNISWLTAIIAVYAQDTLYFSPFWPSFLSLYNSWKQLVEITEKHQSMREFHYISSGKIIPWETLIFSTTRLLDTLSEDDVIDVLCSSNVHTIGKDLLTMVSREYYNESVGVIVIKKEDPLYTSSVQTNVSSLVKDYALKACDNFLVKKWLSYIYQIQDIMAAQWKVTLQIVFWTTFCITLYIVYLILSSFLTLDASQKDLQAHKELLFSAQNSIITASESLHNSDIFALEIEKAEKNLDILQSKNLFTSDSTKLREEIYILQKQFNGVEIFFPKESSYIMSFTSRKDVVKVLGLENKIYLVTKKSVIGPVFSWQTPQERVFNKLTANDVFQDATSQEGDIILITQEWKLVRYADAKYFSYIDITGDTLWQKSNILTAYGSNIYLTSEDERQILVHKRRLGAYGEAVEYLKDADSLSLWKILSLAIDGWIYILKHDGSLLKFFRVPGYRLESLSLNNLPENYNFDKIDVEKLPSVRARIDLAYVYMLLDHRIYVFQPNSKRYQDTKSLKYIGQIERSDIEIQDFYVEDDGELVVASDDGVYRLSFEIEEDRLFLR